MKASLTATLLFLIYIKGFIIKDQDHSFYSYKEAPTAWCGVRRVSRGVFPVRGSCSETGSGKAFLTPAGFRGMGPEMQEPRNQAGLGGVGPARDAHAPIASGYHTYRILLNDENKCVRVDEKRNIIINPDFKDVKVVKELEWDAVTNKSTMFTNTFAVTAIKLSNGMWARVEDNLVWSVYGNVSCETGSYWHEIKITPITDPEDIQYLEENYGSEGGLDEPIDLEEYVNIYLEEEGEER